MKIPAVVGVFAFVGGALLVGCLGSVMDRVDPAGISLWVAFVALLLWAARGLPGAVSGHRYPLRDSKGRFVSRVALRKAHENNQRLAGLILRPSEPNGMYPDGASMWPGKGQPSPYSDG